MDALASSSDEETLTWNPNRRLENFSVGPRLTLAVLRCQSIISMRIVQSFHNTSDRFCTGSAHTSV